MQILKVIGLLMEYPDEWLWACKDDALTLVRHDAPMLTDFTEALLNAPLLDKQAEWCPARRHGSVLLRGFLRIQWRTGVPDSVSILLPDIPMPS